MTAAPDLPAPVVAFRSWRLAGGRLMSPFREAYWCEGVVSAWGRVVVHPDGFRAEHARVEALAVPEGLASSGAAHVHRAAAALGVPVVPHAELEGFADRMGGGVPDALRPEAH